MGEECVCVCTGCEEKMEGCFKRNKLKVCMRRRIGVGFSDVPMTSGAEGRCVKARGPPVCMCVCVCASLGSPLEESRWCKPSLVFKCHKVHECGCIMHAKTDYKSSKTVFMSE